MTILDSAFVHYPCRSFDHKKVKPIGLISIGKLNTLLHVHLQPIYHVVFMESHWDTLS